MKGRLILILASLAAICAARADYDSEAAARKADYYFLEAMRQRTLEKEDLSTALMSRALDLSADKTVREAYEVGGRLMMFGQVNRDSVLFARGLELCEGYFSKHPDDLFAGSYLASYHSGMNHVDRAIAIYETLEKNRPDNVSIVANHADLLLRAQRLDEAIGLYRRLEKTIGRNPALTQRITNVLVWQGDTLGALAEIDDLIASQPRSVEALQLGASAASQFGFPDKALAYIDRAKELDPANGTTYYYAANVYKSLGRTDDYDAAIRGAITGDDLERDAKVELLRFYINEEMTREGEGHEKIDPLFESLVGQYTHDYQIRVIYMSYLAAQQRWAEAAEQMEQAVAVSPDDPNDFIMLARLYGSADNLDGLLSATAAGLAHHPSTIDLYQLRAAAFTRQKDYSAAMQALRGALSLDSIPAEERSDLYRDIADLGQQQKAAPDSIGTYYEKSLELNPENDLAMNNYAYWLATSGGDLMRAKELIAKAVVFEPGSATYYDTYAWVCYMLGELQDAKRYIDMAILFDKSEQEGNPESMAEMLAHAADIYDRLGQKDKADDYRQRAADLEKTDENQ